jgi:hypothetical protein
MCTENGIRVIATLFGGGFLMYAAAAVFRGTLYDPEDGHVNRSDRPVTFWLFVCSMTTLGMTILGVGWRWAILDPVLRLIGQR